MLGSNLKREVSGRKCVGAAKAEHQVDIGSPRPNATDRHQGRTDFLVVLGIETRKVKAADDCLGGGPQGAHLWLRESRATQVSVRRQEELLRREWAHRLLEADPDCFGARNRYLLAYNDAGQAFESGRAPPQWRFARLLVDASHDLASATQRAQAGANVLLAFDAAVADPADGSRTKFGIPIDGRDRDRANRRACRNVGRIDLVWLQPLKDASGRQPILRFAPSPNGALHLGHALSAFVTFEFAKRLGGRFLLRIEDIDKARTREHYVQAIYEILAWLGLQWESPVLRQSEHFADYLAAARKLEGMDLLYPCFATRGEILAAARPGALDPDGAPLYPGICRDLSPAEVARRKAAGQPYAMRLNMARALRLIEARGATNQLSFKEIDDWGRTQTIAADPALWGDVVIQRRDVPTSYHLSVVIDDARQGITHVTRGADLFASTSVHRVLQILLDLPEPLYHHHRLVTDAEGRKLSKSAGDTGIAELRARGYSVSDIRRLIGLNRTAS